MAMQGGVIPIISAVAFHFIEVWPSDLLGAGLPGTRRRYNWVCSLLCAVLNSLTVPRTFVGGFVVGYVVPWLIRSAGGSHAEGGRLLVVCTR
jgi:hypothetical protein